jgi:hypothetical protein
MNDSAIAARLVSEWEKEQCQARKSGQPSLLVARGTAVVLTPMSFADLRDWAWITEEWAGRASGDLRGYALTSAEGADLGVILQRGRLVHAEWLNPSGEHEFAGQVRTLQIAANYIMDGHDALARVAGAAPRVQDDELVRSQLVAAWVESSRPAEPELIAVGTKVVYSGSLADHHRETFILRPHDHMYEVASADDCDCDPHEHYTLVSEGSHRALLHVHRSHFGPAA